MITKDAVAERNTTLADEIRQMMGTGNSSYFPIFRAIKDASVDIRDHFERFGSLELLEAPGIGKRAKEVVALRLKYGIDEGRSIFRRQRTERRRRKDENEARAIMGTTGCVGLPPTDVTPRYDWDSDDEWERRNQR